SGGEIRDEGATGIGARPKAGPTGFTVSHLRIPGLEHPWEIVHGKPERIASALQIMLDGPIGAAAFNNEFGRPNLGGYFRTFEQTVAGEARGYHKPIMIAGGLGNIAARDAAKRPLAEGALIVQLGGPGLRIGMGGGAASSMATGANVADLDFDSVQRANAEMQRRAQEVIDRCWQLGDHNPILSIHDVGAGGLSNALPELAHNGGKGAQIDLRAIPSQEPGMSPRELWCNEAQERYVLAIRPEALGSFQTLCERERCPFAVLGRATEAPRLVVTDPLFGNAPVDMELAVLLGKPPKMVRDVAHVRRAAEPFATSGIDLRDAAYRVLQFPAVADKTFLVTIGDRTVGGLCARDPMVGPWQVPVADVAVTLMDFDGYAGEAMSVGERTPLALLDAPASGRIAVGEAITNLAAAGIRSLWEVKLSANWMAAAGHSGDDAALYDTVRAVALELCPALGVAIPVGKDSMSMRTTWRDGDAERSVTAPVSLVVSAFARVPDARRVLTPELALDRGDTLLLLIDLGNGQERLGGSALAQVYGRLGTAPPDLDDPELLKSFFAIVQSLHAAGRLLAYHDRSDGGLFATLVEMAFASRCGLAISLDELPGEALAGLFSEELGAVVQVACDDRHDVVGAFEAGGLRCVAIGEPASGERVRIVRDGVTLFDESRVELQRAWSSTSHAMQRLRDHPEAADQEYERILDAAEPGFAPRLSFDPAEDIAAPFIARGARPRVAILREQGVNGHVEMAAAFDRAGFAAFDVHMTDLVSGRASLSDFRGVVAGGGFSYGDVLGAGEGWAKSILFHPAVRAEFERFFARGDAFAFGICNGCQMFAALKSIIPGTSHWPRFVKNRSEQYEARFSLVEVLDSPSVLFKGMTGSVLPIAVAHGEGRAEFESAAAAEACLRSGLVGLRYVNHDRTVASTYPDNPSGTPFGIAALSNADGRITISMPHPERSFRYVQNSWRPRGAGEYSGWTRIFRNARRFVD
ncbi:MAG TPA: phosphoribosylformylglycinamidine synthase, partial [Casimicrobiaceae bacterium]|nr:phosphoribosylformylglycinamidine synthase [Casimicrobiaceae bacterium]